MQYLLLCLTAISLTSLSVPQYPEPEITDVFREDLVYVEFTNRTTFADLVRIQADLAEKNITLDYLLIEFDKGNTYQVDGVHYNTLKGLGFTVDCHDGFSGSETSRQLMNGDTMSILRDYRDGAKVPFGINVRPEE